MTRVWRDGEMKEEKVVDRFELRLKRARQVIEETFLQRRPGCVL